MTLIHKFLSALAIAGKSVKKLQETVKKVDGNKALKRTKIYETIKKLKDKKPSADQMGLNWKRLVRNLAYVANVTTPSKMDSDRCITVRKHTSGHSISTKAIHAAMHKDLNLSKKLARWVPNC
jgi:hypothetical protein